MSYGLTQAGIDVIAGIDIDLSCKETYETNVPNSIFIHADITKFKEDELNSVRADLEAQFQKIKALNLTDQEQ